MSLKKRMRVAHRMDAADFIAVNGADRDRFDPAAFAAGDDQHFGFVVEALRALEQIRNQAAVDHAKTALRVGNVLAADPADLAGSCSDSRNAAAAASSRTSLIRVPM